MLTKIPLFFLLITTMTTCLKKPVLHRENYIPISKYNIKEVCSVTEESFPDYSCKKYFNKTYTTQNNSEKVKITLNKKTMIFIYEAEEKNDILFDQFEKLIGKLTN